MGSSAPRFWHQGIQELRHDHILFGVVAERQFGIQAVHTSTPDLATLDVTGVFQVGDLLMCGSLSNAYVGGNLSSGAPRIMLYVAEHQAMIGDEGPARS